MAPHSTSRGFIYSTLPTESDENPTDAEGTDAEATADD
jgi:hypothetical protein